LEVYNKSNYQSKTYVHTLLLGPENVKNILENMDWAVWALHLAQAVHQRRALVDRVMNFPVT
jgi:hypothetical protein